MMKSWQRIFGLTLTLTCLIYLMPGMTIPHRELLHPFRISGRAQGTSYHITYYAADSRITQSDVDSLFSRIDSSLSIYKSYSLISRFNRSSSGIEMDELLYPVVKRSLEIYDQSGGVFDISVYPIVEAWGFGMTPKDKLPDQKEIRKLMTCTGSDKIRIEGRKLIKDQPCIKIDVNGIAQGYSVDLLALLMERKGIKNYLIEVGGEVRVRGRKQPGNELMKIGIEQPDGEGNIFQKIIEMENGAITTSGNYRKYKESGGKKLSHLMDPKTGYPIDNEIISVTVRAPDAMTSDAYDNVLIGLGLEKALEFLRGHKELEAFFIYLKPNGVVADTASAGFETQYSER